MTPVLTVRAVGVQFGGVRALIDVDLEVAAARIVGVIGANGAGKTTFIDAVTGFVRSSGRVALEGRDITRVKPHRRARLGLTRTFQANELFGDLTVIQNVHVARYRATAAGVVRSVVTGRPVAEDDSLLALARLGIEDLAEARPDEISHGQRKLVSVARAIVTRPTVVCLDEPAAGLDPTETARLGTRLRAIAQAGTAVVLVDHDLDLVLSVSDAVTVLDFGRVISRGTAAQVRDDPLVHAAYLGVAEPAAQTDLARRAGARS